jgi:hypothetical protein
MAYFPDRADFPVFYCRVQPGAELQAAFQERRDEGLDEGIDPDRPVPADRFAVDRFPAGLPRFRR